MRKIILLLSILFIANNLLFSIDTNSVKFFPLVIGSIYVYKYQKTTPPPTVTIYSTVMVTKDSVFNNHKYYKFHSFPSGEISWFRVDSVKNYLMKYTGEYCPFYPNEITMDSLPSSIYNISSRGCKEYSFRCTDTGSYVLFGVTTIKKTFSYAVAVDAPEPAQTISTRYAKNFGFYYGDTVAGLYSSSKTLTGCILNGIVYGDTSNALIGISGNSTNELPEKYRLFQNSPNPFNPTTTISYIIPNEYELNVKLFFFDIKGKIIDIFSKRNPVPGINNMIWTGTNLSSGIYFYKLEVSTNYGKLIYSQSKKMILLK